MHLYIKGQTALKAFTAAPESPGFIIRVFTGFWRLLVSLCLLVLTSGLAMAQLWSYTVYVIPGAGNAAFQFLSWLNLTENVVPIETFAPWVSIEPHFGLTAWFAAIMSWAILPTLSMGGASKWYGSALEFPVMLHSLVLGCEAFSLISLRSRISIAFFPRIFTFGFLYCSLYALAFDYNGYWGLAILTFGAVMMAVGAFFWCKEEIPALLNSRLSNSKPREFSFPVVVGLQNGAAPPLNTLFQLQSPLHMSYTEEGRMRIEGPVGAAQAGVWLNTTVAEENAPIEVVQEDREDAEDVDVDVDDNEEGEEVEEEEEEMGPDEEAAADQNFAPVENDVSIGDGEAVELQEYPGTDEASSSATGPPDVD